MDIARYHPSHLAIRPAHHFFFLQKININFTFYYTYTQNNSRCIKAARERISGSVQKSVTGVSKHRQHRCGLKDEVYMPIIRHACL
ncbi:hypothetical protein FNI11_07225 [Salmonella enterica subsp. salamae]|nr:hypothetical protein [Salmonella enterica subsp. salamae]ECJ2282739.1 hypothetical protein [Salmonella enterica subsp. salamae]